MNIIFLCVCGGVENKYISVSGEYKFWRSYGRIICLENSARKSRSENPTGRPRWLFEYQVRQAEHFCDERRVWVCVRETDSQTDRHRHRKSGEREKGWEGEGRKRPADSWRKLLSIQSKDPLSLSRADRSIFTIVDKFMLPIAM